MGSTLAHRTDPRRRDPRHPHRHSFGSKHGRLRSLRRKLLQVNAAVLYDQELMQLSRTSLRDCEELGTCFACPHAARTFTQRPRQAGTLDVGSLRRQTSGYRARIQRSGSVPMFQCRSPSGSLSGFNATVIDPIKFLNEALAGNPPRTSGVRLSRSTRLQPSPATGPTKPSGGLLTPSMVRNRLSLSITPLSDRHSARPSRLLDRRGGGVRGSRRREPVHHPRCQASSEPYCIRA